MPQIEVVEVESSAQLKAFIKYPNRLYREDPNYVTPLITERLDFFDREKNPFFRTSKTKLFLAMRNGQIEGRIATCINYDHDEYHGEKIGFFGFFDCPDNEEIAALLLKVAMIWLKKEGAEKMRGPASFSTNHECGFLVEGFDSPPMVMMTYNRPYLPRLAEKSGFKKAMDLLAYRIDRNAPLMERFEKVTKRIAQRTKVNIRNLRLSDFNKEIERIHMVYNKAWEQNWGFVPMSRDEFFYMARNMKQIVDPELIYIAEHEGEVVGFSLALPNINQALIHLKGRLFPTGLMKLLWHTKIRNKIDTARVITLGIVPEFQKRGIDALMYVRHFIDGPPKGYKWAEMSWILETNELMRSALEQMGATVYKRYRLVEKPL